MKLKLDENIGRRGVELLRGAGHDAATIRDQGLQGSSDENVFGVCVQERRVLLTFDRDFGDVLRFPPEGSAGVIILDVGRNPTIAAILERLREFLVLAGSQSPEGALWIVEPGRVRIHLRD